MIFRLEIGLSLIIASAIWGMAFYEGLFVYPLLIVLYFLVSLSYKNKVTINTGTVLFVLLIISYLIGIMSFNEKTYNSTTNDIINMVSICICLFLVNQFNIDMYRKCTSYTKKIILLFVSILSLVGLYKYYMLSQGVYLSQYYYNGSYIFGTSLIADNNMFALSMLIGLLSGISLYLNETRIKTKVYYIISLLPIIATIIFSGSRRSYVILVILLGIAVYHLFKSLFVSIKLKKVIIGSYFATFSLTIIFVLIYYSGNWEGVINILDDPQIRTTFDRILSISGANFGESVLPRSDRWWYAFQIFKEYNLINVLFGNGFGYLDVYVERFPSNVTEDYPHNPILSALLYSGLVGATILSVFILWVFKKMYTHRYNLGYWFVSVYLCTFVFTFVSGNSIFSYKLLLVLTTFIIMSKKIFNGKISDEKEIINSNHEAVKKKYSLVR